MKFFIKAKHLIVTALLFFAFSSFILPAISHAATVDDVFYGSVCRNNEALSIRCWGKSFILGNSVDSVIAFACGGENDKEKIWGETNGAQGCVPPLEQYTFNLEGDKPRVTGGLMSMSGMAMDYGISEPVIPTDMALFLDDTFNDTLFTPQETYAQSLTNLSSPDEFFQLSTFTLWKFSRNIALGLLGVLLAVAGLSILFRSKLSPQVTVTVSNVLPYLPLSIIGIVLSYPIIAVAYNLLDPLLSIAWAIGSSVYEDLAPSLGFSGGNAGFYVMLAVLIPVIFNPASWILVTAGAVISFPLIVGILTAVVLILWALIKYIFEYVKTIIMFVFYVVAFPIISAIAILPGKQGLITMLFKKVLANLLALPIMTMFVLVGFGFIASMADTSGNGVGVGDSLKYLATGGVLFTSMIKFGIGFGVIMQSFKARKLIEGMLGAEGDLMSSFKGAPPSGGAGGKR